MNVFGISSLQNLDLLLVGITIAAIGILGFIVLFNNTKSITNRTFFIIALITIAYGTLNYISYQVTSPKLVLWFLRLTLFFATLHAFSFFQLAHVFPKDKHHFSKKYKLVLIPSVLATAILTLTPLVFSRINQVMLGQVTNPERGPGIAIFGLVISILVISGIFLLAKKTLRAKGLEKNQFQIISAGTAITFLCLIVFNFVFPVIFNNLALIPLAPIFFLPFIALSAYAIIRYKFLDIKVIATEILTFVLAVVTLFEVLFANILIILLFRIAIFIAVLGFGILLIRSVRKEVEQREQLQKLTQDLAIANDELKKLDRAKSEFVSIASHQLRTPLTAMKGYLSLILEGTYGALDSKFKKPINNIYQSNQRLTHLVNDLLSLSRIESGKIKLAPEQTNVEELAESVIDELTVKAEQKKLQLILQESKVPIASVFVDAEKIRNVILNLIDNSIRYTKEGSITTSITSMGKVLRITIQDTGEGMSKEEIKKLFRSFSRGEAGKELSANGAGLGLYIAKQFTELHKGKIWAESAGKGKGSTFYVELPVRQ
jgi:signal transduction histidine kinase